MVACSTRRDERYIRPVALPNPSDDHPHPSWRGAPGYVPHPDTMAPHAPMPGAPPYPAPEQDPPTVGERAGHTGFPLALLATLAWAAVSVALVLIVRGPPPSAEAMGRTVGGSLAPALLAAVATWLVVRRHSRAFWVVLLVAAPFYWVLRVLLNAAAVSGSGAAG